MAEIIPLNSEAPEIAVNEEMFNKINPSKTIPSKIRSIIMVANAAEIGVSCSRLRTAARSSSPARAG